MQDRGVSHVSISRTRLRVELQTSASGLVVLHARGQRESSSFFRTEPPDAAAERTMSLVDDRWTGRWVGAVLRLEGLAGDAHPHAHELRCVRASEAVGAVTMELLRCSPIAAYDGLPWEDPLPPYLRVPLVFALDGDVQVWISGGDDSPLEVSLAPAP